MQARNNSNNESKRKLILSAKKLFYNQGYTATTLAQISEDSKVNNGLINYYFGSKSKLAAEINTEFLLNLRNEVARQLYLTEKSYSLAIGVAVESRIHLLLRLQNPNLLRFNIEFTRDQTTYQRPNEKRVHYYELQKRLINPNISDLDLRFYEVCGIRLVEALLEAYNAEYLVCEADKIADYTIRMLFHMLQLPVFQIEALLEQSIFLTERLNMKVGPEFRFITDSAK